MDDARRAKSRTRVNLLEVKRSGIRVEERLVGGSLVPVSSFSWVQRPER